MELAPPYSPRKTSLEIIGAGLHALTFVTHLLQKRAKMRSKFAVFDPSGRWMSRWRGCNLFIIGGLTALQVGPTARNLSGARMASEKIIPAIFN